MTMEQNIKELEKIAATECQCTAFGDDRCNACKALSILNEVRAIIHHGLVASSKEEAVNLLSR